MPIKIGNVRFEGEAATPSPVPQEISRPQGAREMFMRSMIELPEMLAMSLVGTPPAMVEALLASLPEPQQSFARADFGRYTWRRDNVLLCTFMTQAILATTPGATEEQISAAIDDFFRAAFAH